MLLVFQTIQRDMVRKHDAEFYTVELFHRGGPEGRTEDLPGFQLADAKLGVKLNSYLFYI